MNLPATRENYNFQLNALRKDAAIFMQKAEHNLPPENAKNIGMRDIELLDQAKRPKFTTIIARWARDCISG